MENNQTNLINEMIKQEPEQPQASNETNSSYESVNSDAETILNIVAISILCGGIFISVFLFIMGITALEGREKTTGTIILAGGALNLIFSIIQWAFAKVFINMSRNLFNLNTRIKEMQK